MKTKIPRFFLVLAIIIFSLSFKTTSRAAEPVTSGAIIEATNELRINAGLRPLAPEPRLAAAAQEKIEDIRENKYFAHNSPDGVEVWDFIKDQGYSFRAAGENLAINYTDTNTLINAWLDSPSHKQNLMQAQYRDIGVAVQTVEFDGRSHIIIVQLFGDPPLLAQQ